MVPMSASSMPNEAMSTGLRAVTLTMFSGATNPHSHTTASTTHP